MTEKEYSELQKGDNVYYVRVMPSANYYEIHELVMVSVSDNYCSGTEKKTKQSFLFQKSNVENLLFHNRYEALQKLNELKDKYENIRGEE